MPVPGLQGFDGVEHQRDAGLHVEHAGAVQAAVGDVAGHGGERAQRIDGVEVAEQQDGLGFFASGEIDLQVVAEVFGAVHARASAEGLESSGEKAPMRSAAGLLSLGDSISTNSRMVRDERSCSGFEIAQALAPVAGSDGLVRSMLRFGVRFSCSACFDCAHFGSAARG